MVIGELWTSQGSFYWADGSLGMDNSWSTEIKLFILQRLFVPRTGRTEPLSKSKENFQELVLGRRKTLILPRVSIMGWATGGPLTVWKLLEPA